MGVTGTYIICGGEPEDSKHVLFSCPHANNLWAAMREVWQLPSVADLNTCNEIWLKSVIVSAEPDMIEAILLTSWRA